LRPENRRHLVERGTVFYLHSDLDSLLERTRKDRSRPLLNAEEAPDVVLQRLLQQRDPVYRETADYIIDTAHNSIRHVIKAIIGHLKAERNSSG
jgi:shikimate kinase